MEWLSAYIPMDRRRAIARGEGLPDRARGAALFADVSGFTPLTEALTQKLGDRRGIDELTWQLNRVYDALIAEVHRYGGSVIGFGGDAITCWLDGDDGLRATACGLAMQRAMGQFATIETSSGDLLETPDGAPVSLAMKVAVVAGAARRFVVGDPQVQIMDVLAGATLDRMAEAEHQAQRGEVVVGPEIVAQLGDRVEIVDWRDVEDGGRFAVVGRLAGPVETDPWPDIPPEEGEGKPLTEEQMRSWLLPPVYESLKTDQARFLAEAELRPAVALFLRFGGIDYDEDEAAEAKLDAYVRWVQSILLRYEGYLLQVTMGDKGSYLYAAFGAPIAHEDDAARAVSAALELREPPPTLDFIGRVQIGISRGRMRTGAYGGTMRRTYGVLGDNVNLAARLMGRAEPGQILVSQRIADAVCGSCHLEYIGPVTVKGKQEPLTVSAVSGRRLGSSQRPATLYTHPLVGRDGELAQMEQLLELTSSGMGQILRLEGEAGLGKSHLAAEFIERAVGRGFQMAMGACQSTGQAVPYYPWRQAFRTLFELTDEPVVGQDPIAGVAEQIAQVEARVNRTNPDWFPRLSLLGDLLGLPIPDTPTTAAFDPKVRQQALFALAVEMVQTWAESQPLLLLIEDMRWIDEASLELTQALGRSIAQTPVLLALVHRPPIRADKPLLPDLNRLSYYHHLDLSELSPQGVAALVANRLQGQPSALTLSLVQAMTQGNPFFTEELVEALRESGALYRQNGAWALSEAVVNALREANCLTRPEEEAKEPKEEEQWMPPAFGFRFRTGPESEAREEKGEGEWILAPNAPLAAADLGIPDSIHGVVLSRLDRLPESHKLSLKVASVIGRIFEFDLLARSHPIRLARRILLGQVEEMEERDFTRLDVPVPQLIYMFKHNITQEVVYGTLLEDQQRELHRAIGEALERLQPEAAERLAHHYFEGQVWAKALGYNLQVARHAQREFANDIAIAAYQRVLKAAGRVDADTSQERMLAHESLGEVLTLVGQYDEALEHYASAQALVEAETVSADWSLHLAELCRKTADVYERRSEYDVAFEWLGKGIGYLDEDEPTIEAARIYILQAGIYRRQGKYDQAIDWCQRSLNTALEIETREGQQAVAQAYCNLGGNYIRRGDLQRGVRFCHESVAAYQQIDDIVGQSKAYNFLGIAYKTLGDWDQASDAYHGSLAIGREIGDIQGQGFVTNNLGNIYLDRGEWAEAARLFEESNTIWRQLGAALPDAVTLSNLAQVHVCQEHWPEAHACLSRSQAIFAEIGSETFLPELERRWGEFYLKTGELDQALAHMRRSIELAVAQEARLEEGISHRVLGQVHLARDERVPAETALRQSLQILSDLDSEYEAAKTMLHLARLTLEKDPAEAQAQLEQAIQTFEKLGARADLAEALALAEQLER